MHNPLDNELKIRRLTTDDLDGYNALLRYAFQVTEDELSRAGWKDDDLRMSKFPILERADVLGCYDEDQLVSQFAVYPLRMNIYGNIVSMGYVTSVTTYPEYSGRGIMRRLMHQSLVNMRDKGQVLALLFPFSIPLYRKFGWETITNKISFKIRDNQIPDRKKKTTGFVRRVDWNNPDFVDLHQRFAMQTHGCLLRTAAAWEEYWRWEADDTTVAIYYSASEKPLAYMVYLIKDDIMHIKEMIYLNREGQNGLWEYIRAHYSMISEVRGNNYFNETIAFDLDDSDITELIRPYIMGRIVDVEHFLPTYHSDPAGKDVTIEMEIEDPFLDWNNRTFNIRFSDGRCFLTNDPPDHRMRMSIGTLTTLLLGYKTAAQLHWMERIQGTPEGIDDLDEAINHEMPYISDYI